MHKQLGPCQYVKSEGDVSPRIVENLVKKIESNIEFLFRNTVDPV